MVFPDIQKFENYRDYFQVFVNDNRQENPAFSYRFLAQRLKWPVSYLSDLVHGRKSLTLARALEFARFAELDIFDTERLVHMSLQDSERASVGEFFKEKLRIEQSTKKFTEAAVPVEEYGNLETFAVFEFLCWSKGHFDARLAKKLLFTFPDLTDEKIERALALLQNHSIIAAKGPGQFEILKNELFFDEPAAGFVLAHDQYAQNFMRFLKVLKSPGFYNSGFVHIPKSLVPKVAERMYMFRNWLAALSKEAMEEEVMAAEQKLVFQYDIDLFPILDPELAQTVADPEQPRPAGTSGDMTVLTSSTI